MNPQIEEQVYKRIGEFVVSFQWLENKLREIGWFVLDPKREEWPPTALRRLTNSDLIEEVHRLFRDAIRKCKLDAELETDFLESFDSCRDMLHKLRRDRNSILHSAFVELKGGGEVQAIMRSNPRLTTEEETGELLFDQEILRPDSFDDKMKEMAEAALFLNRAYTQLIHRYPTGNA